MPNTDPKAGSRRPTIVPMLRSKRSSINSPPLDAAASHCCTRLLKQAFGKNQASHSCFHCDQRVSGMLCVARLATGICSERSIFTAGRQTPHSCLSPGDRLGALRRCSLPRPHRWDNHPMAHLDIPGLVAGFAVSAVIGVMLYIYLTVG
jgi:hypothetical protein